MMFTLSTLKSLKPVGLMAAAFILLPQVKVLALTTSSDRAYQPHTVLEQLDIAQTPAVSDSKKALISQLLEMAGGQQRYEQMQAVLYSQMRYQIPLILEQTVQNTSGLSPEEESALIAEVSQSTERLVLAFAETMQEEVTYSEMLERVYYPVYNQYFTEANLQDLIAFYETPVGQKLVEISPQLFQTSMERTNEIFLPRMLAIMGQLIEAEINQANQ
ncbi:MAG: DUF2059 domain-containing protein [Cyanobacteria bacterium P01_H01_bin.58]